MVTRFSLENAVFVPLRRIVATDLPTLQILR